MRACSFCGTVPADSSIIKCRQCGAPLSMAGQERRRLPAGALDRVPPAPRRASLKQVSGTSGFMVLWGALFGGIGGGMGFAFLVAGLVSGVLPMAGIGGFFFLIFGGIGGAVLFLGYRSASRELRAFRVGQPVEATLLTIQEDPFTRVNGRHPYRIAYVLPWNGEERGGECSTFDARARRFEEGDAIIVLVDPSDPENQALYLR